MDDFGNAVIKRGDDGTLTVVTADPIIGISAELLADADDAALPVDSDGLLWLAGDSDYRYRPVRFADRRVVVCERVET